MICDLKMETEFQIIDVTPRDGLQNEPVIFSLEQKLDLIRHSIEAGLSRIEAASFVNPKKVPQMADPENLLEKRYCEAFLYFRIFCGKKAF